MARKKKPMLTDKQLQAALAGGKDITAAARRRLGEHRRREERSWAAKSGPVSVRVAVPDQEPVDQ